MGGIGVLDVASLFAGPMAAALLGDMGARVTKLEHPRGDSSRSHGKSKDGHSLWWKFLGRNKAAATLNLAHPKGQALLRRLIEREDVLIESFRPGTMERWGLGWEQLSEINPGLVMLRVSGFGQTGPYAGRPGFGTLAEAMSGFAYVTGEPSGPPTLPPFGLADSVAAITGAMAVLAALYGRDAAGGRGEMIDLAVADPILHLLGVQAMEYDQLGVIQERNGNRSANNAPRNLYKAADDRWVAISTSASSVAERLMVLVGRADLVREEWFKSGRGRVTHADELDRCVADWVAARTAAEVLALCEQAGAAAAVVNDVAHAVGDAQYRHRGSFALVDDPDLGHVVMPNTPFRTSGGWGGIRFAGRRLGADNSKVFGKGLGLTEEELEELKVEGAI